MTCQHYRAMAVQQLTWSAVHTSAVQERCLEALGHRGHWLVGHSGAELFALPAQLAEHSDISFQGVCNFLESLWRHTETRAGQ